MCIRIAHQDQRHVEQ